MRRGVMTQKNGLRAKPTLPGAIGLFVLLTSPIWVPRIIVPAWRNSGGFGGPAGIPAIAFMALVALAAAGFIVGWSVRKGSRAADKD
jgi:hypothetical protein